MTGAGGPDPMIETLHESIKKQSQTAAFTVGYNNPLGKKLGIFIMPMLEISRNAIFTGEKAPAGCSLLTPGL